MAQRIDLSGAVNRGFQAFENARSRKRRSKLDEEATAFAERKQTASEIETFGAPASVIEEGLSQLDLSPRQAAEDFRKRLTDRARKFPPSGPRDTTPELLTRRVTSLEKIPPNERTPLEKAELAGSRKRLAGFTGVDLTIPKEGPKPPGLFSRIGTAAGDFAERLARSAGEGLRGAPATAVAAEQQETPQEQFLRLRRQGIPVDTAKREVQRTQRGR